MQKEALSELSLSDQKQKLLGNEAAVNSLFRVAFIPRKKTKRKPTINPLSREVLNSHEEDGKAICTCMNRYYHKLSHLLFMLLETPLYLFPKETHLFFPERLFLFLPLPLTVTNHRTTSFVISHMNKLLLLICILPVNSQAPRD